MEVCYTIGEGEMDILPLMDADIVSEQPSTALRVLRIVTLDGLDATF
jgi:hypothetical protein